MQHYFSQIVAQGANAPAALRDERFRHIRWLIQNQPASRLAGITAATMMTGDAPDPEHYELGKALWLEQAEANSHNGDVLMNAARFVRQQDTRLALDLMHKAHAVAPGDLTIDQQLGDLLGDIALHGEPDLSKLAMTELQNCGDLKVCTSAALVMASDRQVLPPGAKELARTILQQAHAAEPMNLMVSERLNALEDSPARFLRIEGNVMQNNLVSSVEPEYPPLARQAQISGVVRMEISVSPEGRVDGLKLISGHPLLVTPAQEAVKRWVYKPTLLNGEPVKVITTVEVRFRYEH